MKRKYDLDLFYDMYISAFENLEEQTDFPKIFYEHYQEGKNNISGKTLTSYKKYDDDWIEKIKSYLPSIDKITRNLKSTLKYQEDLTVIEKAKKTDKRSVMHLAANTHLIKEVKPTIIPKKVLVNYSELEYGIYENRMVMTLVHRLANYIDKRIKEITSHLLTETLQETKLSSNFSLDDEEYDITFEVKNKTYRESMDNKNKETLEKAKNLHKQINNLKTSQFMAIMKNEKPVTPPIMKTQIILKNQDYKNAYHLWLYLDQYDELTYETFVDTKQKRFDSIYKQHLTQNVLSNLATILVHEHKSSTLDEKEENKYKKFKSTLKTVKNLELNLDLDAKRNNNDELNEYFLEQMKQTFTKDLDINSETYQTDLQSAISKVIEIQNAIYEKALKIDSDEQVFKELTRAESTSKEYKNAIRGYDNLKLIRKEKQKDLTETIRLEQKWRDELILKTKEFNEETYKEALASTHLEIKKEQQKANQLIKKLEAKHKLELKKLKEKHKIKILKQKEQEKIKKQAVILKEKERIQKKKEEQNQTKKQLIEDLKNKK